MELLTWRELRQSLKISKTTPTHWLGWCPIAASRLVDDPRSGPTRDLGSAVGRAIVYHHYLAQHAPREVTQHPREGIPFVQHGDDHADTRAARHPIYRPLRLQSPRSKGSKLSCRAVCGVGCSRQVGIEWH